jgi:chitinase
MVSFRSGVTAAVTILSVLVSLQAVPLADKLRRLSPSAREVLKRSTPAAPRFMTYNDKWLNPFPSASQLQVRDAPPMLPSFWLLSIIPSRVLMSCEWLSDNVSNRTTNIFSAITFLLASGSVDEAQNWQELTASQRTTYVQEYNAAGISLLVSGFGSTETPTSSGVNAVTAANTMAAWVIEYGVNGIDVDYEVLAFNNMSVQLS